MTGRGIHADDLLLNLEPTVKSLKMWNQEIVSQKELVEQFRLATQVI